MKKIYVLIIATFLLSAATQAVTFDSNHRYSADLIDCIYGFKANTSNVAFKKYDASGTLIADNAYGKSGLDYVPGLVAKAVIEAVEYYQGESFAAPWFYSIQAYGNQFYNGVSTEGKSLDDLNAVKLYFGLRNLTKPTATFANETTYANANTALTKAAAGLTATNNNYSINHSNGSYTYAAWAQDGSFDGGWWHKSGYPNQMWCDGQYMGPALLAQLLHEGYTLTGNTADECWAIIAKQIELTWSKLWNPTTGLMYHAFSASPSESEYRTSDWADPATGLSQEYWGRAEGWYFLALVDILEQMPEGAAKEFIKAHLVDLATGLKAKQHSSGCWYQLLNHDGSFSVTEYPAAGVTKNATNYLESSCTAIFAAAYLKAIRLGFLDRATFETTAQSAYQGLITQFWTGSMLTDCCASAGLGGKGKDSSNTRDGSAAYYLLGSDVTHITTYTEGKVLGAAILAAVEYERAYLPAPAEGPLPQDDCNCLSVTIQ